jgi:hypothetical protein
VSEGVAAAATVGAKGEEVEVAEEEEEAEEGRGKVVLWRCVAAEPGKTTAVFVRFIYKRSFCQDRLGTNIAKALKKRVPFSCSHHPWRRPGAAPTAGQRRGR